ncbi:hypothetical protein ACWIUD_10645 [Helicobacter sp. 23-1044]
MNSLINALLFITATALLVLFAVLVNVYMKGLELKDLNILGDWANLSSAESSTNFAESSTKIAESSTESNKFAESWRGIFAKKEIPHFRYPAPEAFITFDLSEAKSTDILQISNLDSYKLFCLKEILKANNVKFTYEILRGRATLRVILDSANKRKNLLNDLKRYNIAYHITKG